MEREDLEMLNGMPDMAAFFKYWLTMIVNMIEQCKAWLDSFKNEEEGA